jgi:hypothetical protein
MGDAERNVPLKILFLTRFIKILSLLISFIYYFKFTIEQMRTAGVIFIIVAIWGLFTLVHTSFAVSLSEEVNKKCGTFAQQNEFEQFEHRIMVNLDTVKGRPVLQKSYLTPSGFFLIHYDTSGIHSVDYTDKNGNGVPDYVDSVSYYAEYSLSFYNDTIGYNSPFKDDGLGGSEAFDIYLMNIGNDDTTAYYGVTRKDKEKLPRENFPRYICHIILDNDYSEFDSTLNSKSEKKKTFTYNGIDGLKITTVHELHHAIQFTYGEQEMPKPLTLYELTSTWFEYRLFPEIKDYMQYVEVLFKAPDRSIFGSGEPGAGYRWSIFGHFVYKKYGDSLLLRMWEMVGGGINAYEALDLAFQEEGSALTDEWCEFLPWLYYTGKRTMDNQYFDDAGLFPEISFYSSGNFTSPVYTESGYLQSFEIRAYRCILPPTINDSLYPLDILIANIDLQSAVRGYSSDKEFTLLCTDINNQDCEQIPGTQYFYGINKPHGGICEKPFFILSNPINLAYPNPFIPEKDITLNIPVPDNALLGVKVNLTIYSVDMMTVHNTSKLINVNKTLRDGVKNDRVVQINNSELKDLSSGVYIYSLEYKGNIYFGKFLLKRIK